MATTLEEIAPLCAVPLAVITVFLLTVLFNNPAPEASKPFQRPIKPQLSSRLLMLPKELRTMIWHHVVAGDDSITITKETSIPSIPPACFACLQLFFEITPIYLSCPFDFHIVNGDGAFTCKSMHFLRAMQERVHLDSRRFCGRICLTGEPEREHLLKWAEVRWVDIMSKEADSYFDWLFAMLTNYNTDKKHVFWIMCVLGLIRHLHREGLEWSRTKPALAIMMVSSRIPPFGALECFRMFSELEDEGVQGRRG